MSQSAITLLNPQDQSAIERFVALLLARRDVHLKLFGSHARGDARRASDIDLALIATQPIALADMALLREWLGEARQGLSGQTAQTRRCKTAPLTA